MLETELYMLQENHIFGKRDNIVYAIKDRRSSHACMKAVSASLSQS